MKYLFLVLLLAGCAAPSQSGPSALETAPSPVAVPAPTPAPASQIDTRKKLLVIGDSISLGYISYLQRNLEAFYQVQHAQLPAYTAKGLIQNSEGTVYTLHYLDQWIAAAGPVDVITWNNGLWDASDPSYDADNAIDLASYEANLIAIATKLKATGARVLFFTSTDIPVDGKDPATGQLFIPGRDLEENAVALRVLPPLGVEVYDLNAMARSNPKLHLVNDPIHFNTQGYTLFGEYIADMVRANYEWSN